MQKTQVFLDDSPSDCAHLSGPYERDWSPNISCLISVASQLERRILAPPRDSSYPKVGGRSCLLRASLYIQHTLPTTEGASATRLDQMILWCLTPSAPLVTTLCCIQLLVSSWAHSSVQQRFSLTFFLCWRKLGFSQCMVVLHQRTQTSLSSN